MINYNNHNITGISYNNHSIKYVYGCGGNLVWSKESEPIYRWVDMDINTNPYCDGVSTFYNQKYQVSRDEGHTWQDVTPLETRVGRFYDYLTTQCGWDANTGIIRFASDAFDYDGTCNNNVQPTGDIVSYQSAYGSNYDWYFTITGDTMPQLNGLNSLDGSTMRSINGIIIPRCVKHIPDYFLKDDAISSSAQVLIGLSEGLETIGNSAFESIILNANMQAPIIIPSTVNSIGRNAFKFNYNTAGSRVLNVVFKGTTPPQMGEIFGQDIALYSEKLNIYVLEGCVNIYKNAFPSSYSGLSISEFTDTVPTIPKNLVTNCCPLASNSKRFTADYSFSASGCRTFDFTRMVKCGSEVDNILDSNEINLGTIGNYFTYNTNANLTSLVVYDDTINTIGGYIGGSKLEYVDMPSSITNINSSAFSGCTNLSTVIVRATVPPRLGYNVFNGTPNTMRIYVPDVEAYKTADKWSDFASKILPISDMP